MLGLGLNHRGRPRRQLVLGYAAFYAVGAYTYGLLNTYFGLGFWAVLPVAASWRPCSAHARLPRPADSRATIWPSWTLGFGEIIRLVLEKLDQRDQKAPSACPTSAAPPCSAWKWA